MAIKHTLRNNSPFPIGFSRQYANQKGPEHFSRATARLTTMGFLTAMPIWLKYGSLVWWLD